MCLAALSACSKGQGPGPLEATTDEGFYVTASFVKPTETIAIASLTVVNRGRQELTLVRAVAVGDRNASLRGVFFADADRFSPGTYREFPPVVKGGERMQISAPALFAPLASGKSALVVAAFRLRKGASVGSIAGVRITYRSGSTEYKATFAEPTVLCRGDVEKDTACQSAVDAARTP
jgi:hypothetical protein